MYTSPPRLLVSFTLTHLTYSQFQIINELHVSNLYLRPEPVEEICIQLSKLKFFEIPCTCNVNLIVNTLVKRAEEVVKLGQPVLKTFVQHFNVNVL